MNKGCVKKYRTAFLILESINSLALWVLIGFSGSKLPDSKTIGIQ
jgi:hypothetical protein